MKKKSLLNVKNLSCKKEYTTIFSNISFHLYESSVLILKGKNGSGKTTLLHSLAGITKVEGKIAWSTYPNKIGYVGHLNALKLNQTVVDHIKFWQNLYSFKGNMNEIIKKFGLKNQLDIPLKLLSFGQRKKIAFVRLFFAGSNIWLLDEPFSGMDKENRNLVSNLIFDHIKKSGSVIVTSHQAIKLSKNINTMEKSID
tara:strand:+ start:1461 stop:2054 length:594 start_codon:yes stop_codon:yes gene_type:complete